MLSNQLSTLLKPYKLLINKHALSATYRAVKLSPGKVTGCSAAAILETKCDHGLEDTVYLEAAAFLSILDSLPDNQEVKFDLDNGVLKWTCGTARGRLAPMAIEDMPSIKRRNKLDAWKPTAEFVKGLRLGGLSCDSSSLLSVGMFGVVIDNRGPLVIHSSDNITISACIVSDVKLDAPERMTLTPEPVALLAELIQPDQSNIEFDKDGLFYFDAYCRCIIKYVPDLKYDALDIINSHPGTEVIAAIPPEAISSFIKRAGALAEDKRHTYISLSASKGQLSLTFEQGVASADEYYLVKDLDVPEMPPIVLDAAKLSRALVNCTEIALDHMDRSVIVLRGHKPEFLYLIGGRGEAKAEGEAA